MTTKEGIPTWFWWVLLVLVCGYYINGYGVDVYSVSLVLLMFVIFGALRFSKKSKEEEKEWDAQIELQGGKTKNG